MEFKLCTCKRKVKDVMECIKKVQKELGVKNNSAEFDFDLVFVEETITDILNLPLDFSSQQLDLPDFHLDEVYVLLVQVESYLLQFNKSVNISKLFESKKSRRSKLEELINQIFVKFSDYYKILISTVDLDMADRENTLPSKKIIKYKEGEEFWSQNFGSGTLVVEFDPFVLAMERHLKYEINAEETKRLQQILDPELTGVHMYLFSEFLKGFGPFQLVLQNVNRVLTSPWFHGYMSGNDCTRLLSDSPPKTFIIRFSQSNPGSFALAFVDADRKVKQFKINPKNTPGEFGFTISELQFSTLSEIVTHFSTKGLLGIPYASKLQDESWFYGEMKAEEASELLADKPPGTFVVRFGRNTSFTATYVDDKSVVRHAAISHAGMGRYQISNLSTTAPVFNSLTDLIVGHSDLFRKPLEIAEKKEDRHILALVEKLIEIDEVRDGDPMVQKNDSLTLWDQESGGNLYSLPEDTMHELSKKPAKVNLYEVIHEVPEKEKQANEIGLMMSGKVVSLVPKNIQKDSIAKNLVKFSDNGEMVAGKLEILVETLLKEPSCYNYITVFLLTYRNYTTPLNLLTLLKDIFTVNATAKDADKNKVIRLRVCNFLKHWINEYFEDFRGDKELITGFLAFVDEVVLLSDDQLADQLRNTIKKKVEEKNVNYQRTVMFSLNPPLPIFPRPEEDFQLFQLQPSELARQLTIYEFSIYKQIQVKELLGLAWTKQGNEAKSPNIIKFTSHFNRFGHWVAHTILSRSDNKERASMIEYFTNVLLQLQDLQNFNGLMGVYSAINMNCVFRLKKVFECVGTTAAKHLASIETLMNLKGNFKCYRETIRTKPLPLLPYLALYLGDLATLEEGYPNQIDEMINLVKCQLVAKVVMDIKFFQQSYFNLWPITAVQKKIEQITQMTPITESSLTEMSLLVEPRAGRTDHSSSASIAFSSPLASSASSTSISSSSSSQFAPGPSPSLSLSSPNPPVVVTNLQGFGWMRSSTPSSQEKPNKLAVGSPRYESTNVFPTSRTTSDLRSSSSIDIFGQSTSQSRSTASKSPQEPSTRSKSPLRLLKK